MELRSRSYSIFIDEKVEYQVLKRSLVKYGQLSPVLVCETFPGVREIVDGNRRFKALVELNQKVDIKNLGPMEPKQRMQAYLEINLGHARKLHSLNYADMMREYVSMTSKKKARETTGLDIYQLGNLLKLTIDNIEMYEEEVKDSQQTLF